MGTQIPKPGVTVEQVFEEENPTLPVILLSACIVGINRQVLYQQEAGDYDKTATSYSYPGLKSGAEVDTDSVVVHLENSYGTFEISDTDYTADSDSVDVEANIFVERQVVDISTTGISESIVNDQSIVSGSGVTNAGLRTFEDPGATFQTNDVTVGQRLTIMGTGADAGVYYIESVDSETQLTVKATPWTGFTSFTGDAALDYRVGADYSVFGDNNGDYLDDGVLPGMYVRITEGNDSGDYRIDKIISDKEVHIDLANIESRDDGASTAASDIFTDTTNSFADAAVGDVLVIETGADAGKYEIIDVVDDDNIQLESALSATATGLGYRIDHKLAASTTQSYEIVDKSNEMTGTILISYKALRNDNIEKLVTINSGGVSEIETKLGTIHPDNEVAYAAFLAAQITDNPFYVTCVEADTSEAHFVAAEFLETREVYALAILSQDPEVHQLWNAHVTAQSDPESKHERICFINMERFVKEVVYSGLTGETTTTTKFEDSGATFVTDGVKAGDHVIPTSGSNLAGESARILRVESETELTLVSPGLTSGETGLAYDIETDPLSKTEQAEYIAAYSNGFSNRRVINIWPSAYETSYTDWDGTVIEDAELPGYFFCAQVAAQVTEFEPQVPHTNQPLLDVTNVLYSNRYFSPTQLNIIAGGGTYIIAQDEENVAPYCRHQLTTDVSSIEKRELSITEVVDYYSKRMRATLRVLVGRNVITEEFLNTVNSYADGVNSAEIDAGHIIGGRVVLVEQNSTAPDTVNVDSDIDVPYPCNYIRVRVLV